MQTHYALRQEEVNEEMNSGSFMQEIKRADLVLRDELDLDIQQKQDYVSHWKECTEIKNWDSGLEMGDRRKYKISDQQE